MFTISMSFSWLILIQILTIISFWTVAYSYSSPDWEEVEKFAEEHPYIVAVLDDRKEYICTGTSINEHTVLTAGSCVAARPAFIALSAVLGDDIDGKSVLRVSHTRVHSSFSYYLSQTQPSETIITGNVALIYVVSNKLNYFFSLAVIADVSPLQLRRKKLTVVGYGELDVGTIVLQRQVYVQKTCVNPQWYYCVCGVESTHASTYENQFGEGGPVILESEVVAVAAAPCGALIMPNTEIKYNIFTVIMQYHSWILDNETITDVHQLEAVTNNSILNAEVFITHIITMLIVNNILK